jgi:hypothetical protein
MNDEETTILNFLRGSPETWFARREIARRAGRRSLFEENPHWADDSLNALAAQGVVEINDSGHYKFKKSSL